MTRLTEALKRANEAGGSPASTAPAEEAGAAPADLPRAWQFEPPPPAATERRGPRDSPDDTPPREEASRAVDNKHPERFPADYPFAKEVLGKLVVGASPDHTLVEQYRHLAAALHHAQLRKGIRSVMITSAIESEGKTTTAANLALTLSHSHQRRVLLIDADLRRPSIHGVFQLPNEQGLGDTLRDVLPEKAPLVHRISPTLSILTAGRPTSDPMSALVSDTMKELIDDASEHFDWVIVDTPPVALLSDANLLAAMIDAAVLVVAANRTAYPLVKRAQNAIGADRILGTVLNRARRADLAVGYGYYYYGYSYAPQEDAKKRRGLARFFRRR